MDVLSADKIGMGTWPDWIAAFGSVFAFVGLVVGLLMEKRKNRLEREGERARQARSVRVRSRVGMRRTVEVDVRNVSDQPIFDVTVVAYRRPIGASKPLTREQLKACRLGMTQTSDLQANGDLHRTITIPPDVPLPDRTSEETGLMIELTDAPGYYWRRFGRLAPVQVKERWYDRSDGLRLDE